MKNTLRFFLSLIAATLILTSFAQVPQKMNYQAVARNSSGQPIINHAVGIKFTIRENSASGPDIFAETMTATTNSMGTFSVEIGGGTAILGSFVTIAWSTGTKYLNVKIDPSGGSSYTDMGTFPLLSVAYAQLAKNVVNNDDADANPNNELQNLSVAGDQLSISSGNTVTIPDGSTTNELQTLSIAGNQLSISSGNTVTLPGGGGTTTPGGASGNVQFNNGGAFGGDANFLWDNTNKQMFIGTGGFNGVSRLTIGGSGAYGASLGLKNSTEWSLTTSDDGAFKLVKVSGSTFTPFRLTNTGKLGINTTADATGQLEITANSDGSFPHLMLTESGDDYARINFKNTSNPTKSWHIAGYNGSADANSMLDFWYHNGTSGTSKLCLRGDGKVGINTSSPAALLDISGGGSGLSFPSLKAVNSNAGGIAATFQNTSSDATLVVTNAAGVSTMATIAKFFDGGASELIKIDNNYGGTTHEGRILLFGNNAGTISGGYLYGSNIYGPTLGNFINNYFHPIASAYYLGSSDSRFEPFYGSTISLGSSSFKWKEVWATNGTIQTSDERDKQNIQPLVVGLNAIMQLKPVSFQWKNQNSRVGTGTSLGFIAQELEQVLPDAVVHVITPQQEIDNAKAAGKGDIQADVYGVKYAEIVPVLVKAIQDQETLIETQQQTINDLIERLNKLENK